MTRRQPYKLRSRGKILGKGKVRQDASGENEVPSPSQPGAEEVVTCLPPTVWSHKSINSNSRSSDTLLSQEEVSKGTLCQSSVLEDGQKCLGMGA